MRWTTVDNLKIMVGVGHRATIRIDKSVLSARTIPMFSITPLRRIAPLVVFLAALFYASLALVLSIAHNHGSFPASVHSDCVACRGAHDIAHAIAKAPLAPFSLLIFQYDSSQPFLPTQLFTRVIRQRSPPTPPFSSRDDKTKWFFLLEEWRRIWTISLEMPCCTFLSWPVL